MCVTRCAASLAAAVCSGCEDVKLAAALVAVLEGTSLVFELLTSSHYTSSMAEYSTLLIK